MYSISQLVHVFSSGATGLFHLILRMLRALRGEYEIAVWSIFKYILVQTTCEASDWESTR